MKKHIRLEESLSETVFDRLLNISKSQRWLVRRNEKLNELFESCSCKDEQLFLCDILDRFTYIDSDTLADSLAELGEKISITWGCTPENTLIVAMDKSRYADSSSAIAWMIKPVLADLGDWGTQTIYKNLTDAINEVKDGQKFVVVDEFVGSGQTLSGRLKWISKEITEQGKSVEIYVATIAAMEICRGKDFSCATDFHSTIWMKQGLNDYYSDEDLEAAVAMMLGMEALLLPVHNFTKLSKYSLGYKKTQSTYYLENGNPPNNNFPIFWWKMWKTGERRTPLIPRV
ncbi:hypothetical protein Q0601_23950 [Paracoccus onubensis]|uniref:phosphoribosyltransferase-like protein n=1 Tax=Paracoccus onubensis TaxID=1675788 RepID=UPI00273014A4|nr:hypothetical protein [Paracoccus onubensis]MDP0930237.1 hypothetical protein [Paracoccus onubensis]